MLRKFEYPFFADWFAISLRWLVLIGVAYSLVLAKASNNYLAGAVLAGVLWNFLNTFMAIFNRRLPAHRILNVSFDFVGTALLFYFSNGFFGPLTWVSLLNLFSAGIYFGWAGSLFVALLISATQVLGTVVIFDLYVEARHIALLTGFNLLSGLLFGMLSQQLYVHLREHFVTLRKTRQDNDEKLRITERRRMQNLYQLIESLSVSLNYKTVLQTALDLSNQVLGSEKQDPGSLVSAIFLFQAEELKVAEARGFPTGDYRLTFPAAKGALQQIVQEGDILHLIDPSQDPELSKLLALRDSQSAMLLPLARGLDAYGLMLFAHRKKDFFDVERQDLLEVISHQVVIAIQNAQLFQDLEAERDRLVNAQEEERKQLARELHDGPTQSVTGIAMRAEYIRKLMEKRIDPNEITNELQQVETLARKTVQEIRHMLFALRPLVLEKEGLLHALETLAQTMKEVYQQSMQLDLDDALMETLDGNKQKVIFQIIEEAVNNARKHAQASLIRINLRYMPKNNDIALLEIVDNGVGFNVEEISGSYERRGSFGMVNLQERTSLINGRLHIDSTPGEGTRIQVAIPLTDKGIDWLQSRSSQKR